VQRLSPQDLIEEVTRRLAAAAPGAKVVLFGSRARGDERPGSDLDLLVIKGEDVKNPRAESARLRRELRGLGVGLDLVVVGAGYAEEWGHLEGSLVNEALSEGRVLVGA
jgi:predicted nucleotidyltransferase